MNPLISLLYQIKLADEQITGVFERQLGLSLTRYQLLSYLLLHAPCSQQKLQEVLQIDSAAVSRHLKILEKTAYIERRRKEENQREMEVIPSQKARQDLVLSPPKDHLAIQAAMATLLSTEEIEQLEKLLHKLVTGISGLPLPTSTHPKGE